MKALRNYPAARAAYMRREITRVQYIAELRAIISLARAQSSYRF